MAVTSKSSHDGSNGGGPTKKPENLHKKLQEEGEKQNGNPQEEENLPIPQHIPEDLIEIIVAFVRRCHYPKLSLISRAFRRLISSQSLYDRRLRLGLTEPVLYALMETTSFRKPSWYILNRNIQRKTSLRLSRITSLPFASWDCAVVTFGCEIYVIGGCVDLYTSTSQSNVMLIECRFHTCQWLPNMQKARSSPAARVIGGKIYVIGGCKKRDDNWIEVLDIKNRIWSNVPGPYPYDCSWRGGGFETYVVMKEKIYILGVESCMAYEPRKRKWKSWGPESQLMRYWNISCCVVDDLLYTITPLALYVLGHPIGVYDPNDMVWRPVNGVFGLSHSQCCWSKIANFGGRLMVLGNANSQHTIKDISCVEIAMERREGGEIWGKVDSVSLESRSVKEYPYIDLCRTIMF